MRAEGTRDDNNHPCFLGESGAQQLHPQAVHLPLRDGRGGRGRPGWQSPQQHRAEENWTQEGLDLSSSGLWPAEESVQVRILQIAARNLIFVIVEQRIFHLLLTGGAWRNSIAPRLLRDERKGEKRIAEHWKMVRRNAGKRKKGEAGRERAGRGRAEIAVPCRVGERWRSAGERRGGDALKDRSPKDWQSTRLSWGVSLRWRLAVEKEVFKVRGKV